MKKYIIDYCFLILGCICFSLGIVAFFAQNQIATGGVAGIALLVNHLSSVSIGTVLIIVHLFLLLMGYKDFGKIFVFRTVIIIFFTSLLTDLMSSLFFQVNFIDIYLLNVIFGGVLVGSGIGFMFKSGGSSGGWSILAKIISKRVNIAVGNVIFLLDCSILVLSVFVFKNLETALYGMIGIFISSKMIDIILKDNINSKSVDISYRNVV